MATKKDQMNSKRYLKNAKLYFDNNDNNNV